LQSTALPLGHTANYHLSYKDIIIDKF